MNGRFVYYCGRVKGNWNKLEVVKIIKGPNNQIDSLQESYGDRFSGMIGPFKTKRGAEWFSKNPYATGYIKDFERMAKAEYEKIKLDRKLSLNKTKEHTFMNGFTRKFDELTAWRFIKSNFDSIVKRRNVERCARVTSGKINGMRIKRKWGVYCICYVTQYMTKIGLITQDIEDEIDLKVSIHGPKESGYKWVISLEGHKQRSEFCQQMIDMILQSKKD